MKTITGFIYYLQNPITGEIFYVGATETSLKNRLRTHYQHVWEVEKDLRNTNKRVLYLLNLRPTKATIHLLEIVTDKVMLDEREIFYIKHFRNINPNLTNMTDGGKGKRTNIYYTEQQNRDLSIKLSNANKGNAKPSGFGFNLSIARQGKNNPNSKELIRWIICFDKDTPLKLFKYGFEVNDYVNNEYAYGNVYRSMKVGTHNAYKMKWQYFDECSNIIQDIVQSDYESNQ